MNSTFSDAIMSVKQVGGSRALCQPWHSFSATQRSQQAVRSTFLNYLVVVSNSVHQRNGKRGEQAQLRRSWPQSPAQQHFLHINTLDQHPDADATPADAVE